MLRSIRYHLDHDVNYHHAIAEALRRRGIDVTISREVGISEHRTMLNSDLPSVKVGCS